MATRSVELATGCFSRAEPDEPMFVLLGRDRLAPWLVTAWAWLRICQIYIGTKPASDFQRCDEALALAGLMRAWRRQRRSPGATAAPGFTVTARYVPLDGTDERRPLH